MWQGRFAVQCRLARLAKPWNVAPCEFISQAGPVLERQLTCKSVFSTSDDLLPYVIDKGCRDEPN